MSFRLIPFLLSSVVLLGGCGNLGPGVATTPVGAVSAEAAKKLAPRPTPQVDTLFNYAIRRVRAANGVTHQVELSYSVAYVGANRGDMVTRRFRADCINGEGELTLHKLTLTNSLMSVDRNGRGKMLDNKALTLIEGGDLKGKPAPSALALDTELRQVSSMMAKGEIFLETNKAAKSEDLKVLTSFAKAAQQALAGR